ncbi:uncharacterized protein LOC141909965 [Tubulanus polymorphus]|uniref:uncharacterized protein LOC141909965 n=1 Tax=Tubulanus polymorphus TaxID=672921 RepID=UPI003DA4DD23
MDQMITINQQAFVELTVDSGKEAQSAPCPVTTAAPASAPVKKSRRGRKPSKIDVKTKLERSRQSARECRARKKLRYQYVEDLVSTREKAILALRNELEMYKKWCQKLDQGTVPADAMKFVKRQCESLDTIEEEVAMDTTQQDADCGIDVPAD